MPSEVAFPFGYAHTHATMYRFLVLVTYSLHSLHLAELTVSILPNNITWGQQLQGASEAVKEAWWERGFSQDCS